MTAKNRLITFVSALLVLLIVAPMALAQDATAEATAAPKDWGFPTADCTGVTMKKIGYSPLTMEFDYFQFIGQGVRQIADQCGVETVIADPNVDAAQQVSDIENMVSAGVGAVAVYSIDPVTVLTAVDTAHAAGVKVIAAVSAFKDSDVSVGISDYDFGRLSAELAGQALLAQKPGKDKYEVAILNADSLGPNLLDRKKGLTDGLSEYVTNYEVVADVEAWAEDTALSAVETILQAHPDLDLILTVNDPGSLGAANAIQSAGGDLLKGTLVAGVGIDKRVLQGVLDGTFPGSVSPEPIATGRALANVAFALNRGDTVDATVVVPVVQITKANAQQYIDELYPSSDAAATAEATAAS